MPRACVVERSTAGMAPAAMRLAVLLVDSEDGEAEADALDDVAERDVLPQQIYRPGGAHDALDGLCSEGLRRPPARAAPARARAQQRNGREAANVQRSPSPLLTHTHVPVRSRAFPLTTPSTHTPREARGRRGSTQPAAKNRPRQGGAGAAAAAAAARRRRRRRWWWEPPESAAAAQDHRSRRRRVDESTGRRRRQPPMTQRRRRCRRRRPAPHARRRRPAAAAGGPVPAPAAWQRRRHHHRRRCPECAVMRRTSVRQSTSPSTPAPSAPPAPAAPTGPSARPPRASRLEQRGILRLERRDARVQRACAHTHDRTHTSAHSTHGSRRHPKAPPGLTRLCRLISTVAVTRAGASACV